MCNCSDTLDIIGKNSRTTYGGILVPKTADLGEGLKTFLELQPAFPLV